MIYLTIARSLYDQILADADARLPEEACGLLAGVEGVVQQVTPITNDLHSQTRFRMHPQEQVNAMLQMEKENLDLIAIYHSHPTGPDYPSETDLAEYNYPGIPYFLLWRTGRVWLAGLFSIDDGIIVPISMQIV